MTREVARVRSRADETQHALMEEGALLQASTHRAAAVERTLRASLEEASSRRDALAREAFEATRATKELREEKEALVDELCSERNRGEALMVAAEALRAKRSELRANEREEAARREVRRDFYGFPYARPRWRVARCSVLSFRALAVNL